MTSSTVGSLPTDNSSLLQLTGLSSGLDTTSIVNSLMSVAEQPKTAITLKQAAATAKQTALQTIQSKLQALSTASDALSDVGTWAPAQSAASADSTKVTATVTGGAGPGGYEVGVQNLATSSQHTFAYTPQSSDSSITIGSETIDVPANSTLDSVVSSINSDANSPTFAVNVNGNLVLAAKTTGASSDFTTTGSSLVEDPTKARVGKDANYTVDGQPFTSASNTVTNGLPGVTLTLVGQTSSDVAVNVSNPGPNASGIQSALQSFVSAYNDAITTIQGYVQTPPVANAQNATDAATGVLFDDPGLQGLLDNLRSNIGGVFAPAGASASDPNVLSDIGLSTGAPAGDAGYSQDSVNGKLTLDTSALQSTLSSDPLGVQRLLGGVGGSVGLAQSMDSVLQPEIQSGGELDQELSDTTDDLSELADQLDEINTRLADQQQFLQNEFSNMEVALAQSQAQGQALGAKLASLTSSSSSSSSS